MSSKLNTMSVIKGKLKKSNITCVNAVFRLKSVYDMAVVVSVANIPANAVEKSFNSRVFVVEKNP